MTETRGAKTRAKGVWHWFFGEQAGRAAAVALLLFLSLASLLLLLNVPALGEILLVRILFLGLPSLLTLLAFFLVASMMWGHSRSAAAFGFMAYLAVGLVLSLIRVGYLESVWHGGLLGIFISLIWPTVTLKYLGDTLGWWPGPE